MALRVLTIAAILYAALAEHLLLVVVLAAADVAVDFVAAGEPRIAVALLRAQLHACADCNRPVDTAIPRGYVRRVVALDDAGWRVDRHGVVCPDCACRRHGHHFRRSHGHGRLLLVCRRCRHTSMPTLGGTP